MAGRQDTYERRNRWLWIGLATPGAIWLIVLFVVPFYVMLCGRRGRRQRVLPDGGPDLESTEMVEHQPDRGLARHRREPERIIGSPALRTVLYTAIATVISLAIAYPVAYFVSRYAGRRKGLFLVLLIAPFWVSYMMRMLAWIDLLQQGGLFNRALSFVGLPGNTDWLGGKSVTVIFGLVYGYIPYLILVLYAFLDRIDQSQLEAARDLGLEQVADLLACDRSAEQAGDHRRNLHHGAADAG